MPVGPRSLCPRCGGQRFERVSETESRCAKCGLGRRTARLVFRSGASDRPEARRQLGALSDGELYRRAGFAAVGLDDRWGGLRLLGGYSRHGELTHSLKLVHGDPFDRAGPLVRIETIHPPPGAPDPALDRGIMRRLLVRRLLGALVRSGQELDPEVRAAAFRPLRAEDRDGAAPWGRRPVTVDDRPVELRMLEHGTRWVGLVDLPDRLVGLDAAGWPAERTGLRSVGPDGLAAYEEGSGLLARRRPPR